eukprot:403361945
MQKVILLSVLVLGALANIKDFPRFDIFHSHCEIRATYKNRTCTDTYGRMNSILHGFSGEDPAHGKYSFVEQNATESYFWTVRQSPKGYKDDVSITLAQVGPDCFAVGRARARSFTFTNKGDTYCDIWNVLKYTDVFSGLTTKSCRIVPVHPEDACVDY